MTATTAVLHTRPLRPRCAALPLVLAAAALLAVPPAASAQYRAAGSELEVVENSKERLEKAMDEAPWRLGKVRIAPWIGVRDVSYVRELDLQGREQEADLTVTAGAGLKAYLPLGSNALAAAHAMPEYIWWRRQDERNAAVGRYGLGFFGWFNRLHGEVTARRVEAVDFLASDLLVREPVRGDELSAKAQVRVLGSIALFAAGTTNRIRVDPSAGPTAVDPSLLLDRDAETLRGGLRYLLRGDRGYFGAGALSERTDFLGADGVRSNKGSSWYAETYLRGNNLDVTVQYDQRELEPSDSSFPGYSAANGTASVVLHPGWRVQYQLYGLRQLRYSARQLASYSEEQRAGGGLRFVLGRANVQLYYERGDDDYFGAITRHDSVTGRGGWIDLPVYRQLNLRVGARRTTFEPDGGAPRELEEVTGALSMTFGPPGTW